MASVLTLTDPTAFDAAPAATEGTSFAAGSPSVISLGTLTSGTVAKASLTWFVSTNNVDGYTMTIASTGGATTALSGPTAQFPDMGSTPSALNTSATGFGIAVGDQVSHSQSAVAFASSPWGSTGDGGSQGTLYRGVGTSGIEIARRSESASNDPVTVNFAAVSSADQPVDAGAYSGSVRLTAITL